MYFLLFIFKCLQDLYNYNFKSSLLPYVVCDIIPVCSRAPGFSNFGLYNSKLHYIQEADMRKNEWRKKQG